MDRDSRFINNKKQDKIRVVNSQPSIQSMREGEEVLFFTKNGKLSRYRKERGQLWFSEMIQKPTTSSTTISPTKTLVIQSSACSSGQDINNATRDIYWASMSTEDNTYVSWSAGSDGYFISFKQSGEYMVYTDLIVTDATADNRMTFFGWITHMDSSNTGYYSYPLGGTYIRDDSAAYDSGGIGGNARLVVAVDDRVKVNTQRFDSGDPTDDNPLDTSLSRIRIERIEYNQ